MELMQRKHQLPSLAWTKLFIGNQGCPVWACVCLQSHSSADSADSDRDGLVNIERHSWLANGDLKIGQLLIFRLSAAAFVGYWGRKSGKFNPAHDDWGDWRSVDPYHWPDQEIFPRNAKARSLKQK